MSSGSREVKAQVDVRGCLVFNWKLTPRDRRDPVVCRLPPDLLTYRIHVDGKIERLTPSHFDPEATKGLIRYVYISTDGLHHELGHYTYEKVTGRGALAGKFIRLMNLNEVRDYSSNGVGFGFENDSRRPYISDIALASLLGAMLETGYGDFSCNGFSHSDGSSTPSTSHINGVNGDLKFLRLDKTTRGRRSLHIDVSPELMDEGRQNLFNDALYRFGWKSMLAWRYRRNGQMRLLNHTQHYAGHHHHLHVQGYAPNVVDV
ncbi:hypothetical protein [Stenotrophomonas sp. Iso1]|uniref:hypothetical protein n=1 Tax=Stenotrophomonas sp. Iso1 TaxID=2977283 RepID=UPI0022B7B7FA|nr:hypothetical protein [Stenotrophomonas sp. Iso1]